LIFGRAVCGAGAAGLFNGSITILSAVTPLSKLPLYFSGFTALFGVATISGPLIGGALTTKASWRWCFYINLPVGAVTLVALIFFFSPPERDSDKASLKEKLRKLDFVGFAMFVPTVVMLLLALQWGGHKYAWKSATVIGLICGAVALLVPFLLWEHHKGDDAMVPFSILLHRSILLSCLFGMTFFGCYIGNVYYIPEWFQVIKGASPLHSGVMLLPAVGAQVVTGVVIGIFSEPFLSLVVQAFSGHTNMT
jgi:MFS family permease